MTEAINRSTVIIDTNVFMGAASDPFQTYRNTDILIPFKIIEDLERHRGDDGGLGWACRSVLNHIEQLRAKNPGCSLFDGIRDDNGNNVRVIEIPPVHSCAKGKRRSKLLNDSISGSAVINTALTMRHEIDSPVTVISNSLPTRLRASKQQISAVPYADDHFQPFTGWYQINSDGEQLTPNDVLSAIKRQSRDEGHGTPSHAATKVSFCDYDESYQLLSNGRLTDINYTITAGNFRPRRQNMDQVIAMNYLMDQSIDAVSLGGVAGSGKSILALAAAIAQVDNGTYDQIKVFRSMYEVGHQEIGFLPGSLDDKMKPWASAIWDNVAQIDRINGKTKSSYADKQAAKQFDERDDRRKNRRASESSLAKPGYDMTDKMRERHPEIDIQPVIYLRGRTFINTFIIVDDAQSLDRSTLLDIITRLGNGSKIVFTHDMSQNDNPYISMGTSIMSVVNSFLTEGMFAHINFTKSERSELAQIAADLLAKEM